MNPTATQQMLVTLVLRTPDGADPVAELERQGALTMRVESVDAARRAMGERESDLFVVCSPDRTFCAAARDMAVEAEYRAPIVFVCPGIEDEAGERMAAIGRDVTVRGLENAHDLVRSWLVLARMQQKVRRFEREIPARVEEMADLRRFTDDLIANLPTRLYLVDEEMRLLFANRTALKDTNAEIKNVIGLPLAQMIPIARDGSAFTQAVRRVLTSGEPSRLLGLRLPASGEGARETVVNVDITPTTLASIKCARVTLDDVTEEWQAEQGRLRETWKLQTVVDAIGAGLAILDQDLRFTWANRAFKQWFGHAIGSRCSEVCGRRPAECIPCPGRAALSGGKAETETWNRYTSDGAHQAVQATYMALPEPGGGMSLILLALDITAQAERIEQMQVVERVSAAVQGVLELDDLLNLILTCVTTGQALGFNRAFLFLRNRTENTLDGRIAVGPASAEDAGRVWGELARRQASLEDALRDAARRGPAPPPLQAVVRELSYSLDDETKPVVRVFRDKHATIVRNAAADPGVPPEFFSRFGAREFVAVPLVSKGRSLGVIMADNLYNNRPITERDMALLQMFGSTAGLAVENAETFADLRDSLNTLRSTRRQLIDQTKLAAIGRVAAHIAHEIRNPLATIGGFAHAIHNRPDNLDRVKASSGIIYDEVMRLERMLSGIMDFSRPSRPVLVFQSLNALVERAIGIIGQQLPEGVKLRIQLDQGLKDFSFDAAQLQQVLINLIRNASEAFAGKGGSIVVSTSGKGESIELVIADDGPGIPLEVQSKVFEPFFTTKKGGTGLGLAVCRHIIAEHGGEIRVDSAPGKGTTMRIVLPNEPPQVPEDLREAEELP